MGLMKWLRYIPMIVIGIVFSWIYNVVADAGLFVFAKVKSAFDMFRQIRLDRLQSRAMVAMSHWIDKVADKSYCLLFGGKKDFTMLYSHALR
jgi:hypothetical protein